MHTPLIRLVPGLLLLGAVAPGARSQVAAPAPAAPTVAARATVLARAPGQVQGSLPRLNLQGDPADSVYRAAREAMTRGRFREAADLMRDLRRRFPRSGYVPDSYYWEAYAVSRGGSTADLRRAIAALDEQASKHPSAASNGDARALRASLTASLARQGDAAAAEDVARTAAAATMPARPASPVAPTAPRNTARAPRAPTAPRGPGAGTSGDACEEEDDVQTAALTGLMQMDPSRALPVLEKVLARRDAGSACLRRRAVFIVAQQAPNAAPILLRTARTDPDAEVRGQAVFWLSQVNSPEAVAALDSILRQSTDRELQERAVFAMSQQDAPRALQSLKDLAANEGASPELRERAVFWLGQKDDAATRAFLRDLYGRTRDEDLKAKIIFGVAQSDDPAGRTWLQGIARDPKEPVEARKKVLFWLGQQDGSAATLAALYGSLQDPEMREQVVFALSQSNEPAATDKLIEIARSDKDQELRKKAIFWLGQSDDPRVTQVLEQILTGAK